MHIFVLIKIFMFVSGLVAANYEAQTTSVPVAIPVRVSTPSILRRGTKLKRKGDGNTSNTSSEYVEGEVNID